MLFHRQARQMNLCILQVSRFPSTYAITRPWSGPRISPIRLMSEKAGVSTASSASSISSSTPSAVAVSSGGSGSGVNAAATVMKPPPARGVRKYAEQFKDKPASHFVAFAILHEITAVVPLPLVYFGLTYTDTKIPFPEQALEEGNKFVGRIAKYYGWNIDASTTDGARMMLNMATSYALVKALMPVRIALCLWMTPWTATRIISPVMNVWKRFVKK